MYTFWGITWINDQSVHLVKWMPAPEQVTPSTGIIWYPLLPGNLKVTCSSADIHLPKCMDWSLIQVISGTVYYLNYWCRRLKWNSICLEQTQQENKSDYGNRICQDRNILEHCRFPVGFIQPSYSAFLDSNCKNVPAPGIIKFVYLDCTSVTGKHFFLRNLSIKK